MKKITIGKVDGAHAAVKIDLAVLKQTRLLITADSGGGKTYLMKKIVEEAFGKIPIHIVDPEGEFAPLREGFDFFLIAKGGDTPPVVGLAKAQAQKFLEIRASVICDIYELKPAQRHEWVREYLEGLIEAPKAMRHPCLVIVDEAHLFAPETGSSVALEAMADLASRGRKRGLILIVATQRLAKLNKDVTSEMLNRLIGPTFEDVNRKRAAEVLGVLKENTREFFEQIKMLEPGHFFALGRAISKTLIRVKIGAIKTKHGDEAEKYNTTPPPARSKIASLLKTLKELPAEEEKKAETAREFRAEIRRLREEVQTLKRIGGPGFGPAKNAIQIDPKKTKEAVQAAVKVREATLRKEYATATSFLVGCVRVMTGEGSRIAKDMKFMSDQFAIDLRKLAERVDRAIGKAAKKLEIPKIKAASEYAPPVHDPKDIVQAVKEAEKEILPRMGREPAERAASIPKKTTVDRFQADQRQAWTSNGEGPINKSQIKILKALSDLEAVGTAHPSKSQVAFWSGASVTSSTFANNVSNLKTRGMITYPSPGSIALDPSVLPQFHPEGLTKAIIGDRARELLNGTQIRMMESIRVAYPRDLSKEELAAQIGASFTSSTFANNISSLKTAGLITYPRSGAVRMADWLDV